MRTTFEELWAHGGSLRIYVQHPDGVHTHTDAVPALLAREESGAACAHVSAICASRRTDVKESKCALLELLIELRRTGKQVVCVRSARKR